MVVKTGFTQSIMFILSNMKKQIIAVLFLIGCSKPQIKHAPIEPIKQDIIGNIKLLPVWYISKEECDKNSSQCVYMSLPSAYNNIYNYTLLDSSLQRVISYIKLTEKSMQEHNKINE